MSVAKPIVVRDEGELNAYVLNKIRAVLLRERGYPLTHQEIQEAIKRELLR